MDTEFFDLKVNKGFAPGYDSKDLRQGRWIKVKFDDPVEIMVGIIYDVPHRPADYTGRWTIHVLVFDEFMSNDFGVDQTQIVEYGPMVSPPAFK